MWSRYRQSHGTQPYERKGIIEIIGASILNQLAKITLGAEDLQGVRGRENCRYHSKGDLYVWYFLIAVRDGGQ